MSEHLVAIEIMKLEHLILLQNKVDLIKEGQALEHQKSITVFVKGAHTDRPCSLLSPALTTRDVRKHRGKPVQTTGF